MLVHHFVLAARRCAPWLLLASVCACKAYDPGLLTPRSAKLSQDSGSGSDGGAGSDATVETGGAADGGDGGAVSDPGQGDCSTQDDVKNCGSCGHVCSVTNGEAACVNGVCTVSACDQGLADCDGDPRACETRANTLADCGGCNIACREIPHAVASCSTGVCGVGRCDASYADCDGKPDNGCETQLGTLRDCGGCDVACNKASCAGGACTSAVCPMGFGDCNHDDRDCEIDLRSDPDHCGSCDNACVFDEGTATPHGTLSCTDMMCSVACDEGFLDCDGEYRNGCEQAFADTDKDGTPDCEESCPNDANKTDPGACGCGKADTDTDEDGTPDCSDACPNDPTQQTACLTFSPSNFDPKPINWSKQPSTTLNCGTTTIDTTDPDGSGAQIATLTNWCGTAPTLFVQNQTSGPQAVIVALRGLTLSSANTLRLVGPRPVIIAVDGTATISGTIDANASGTTPGAGGNWSCGSSQGGNGTGSTKRLDGASGGGGGGFQTAGGHAGVADTDHDKIAGGIAGVTRGSANLTPLIGGCAGGQGGGCSTAGGAGGGALQISVSGALRVNGTIRASGGDGATPCGANDEGGGTGGGSGGAILLESTATDTSGSTIQVNGGSGGANGDYDGIYKCGSSTGGSGATGSGATGGNGTDCQGGSSGGGGGYGRYKTNMK